MTSHPDLFREWDAAYVLGALSAADRRDYEQHLSVCPACSAAVAELAGLPGILAEVPAEEAVAINAAATSASESAERLRTGLHQPGQVQGLARAAVRRTRRNRIRWAALATATAGIVMCGGLLLGSTFTAGPELQAGPVAPTVSAPAPTGSTPATLVVAMQPLEPNALTADLTITETDWGTRFDWSCVYLNELWKDNGPQGYDMVMTDVDGTSTVLATWSATSPSTENLAASTDLPSERIASVEIRATESGTPLAHSDL